MSGEAMVNADGEVLVGADGLELVSDAAGECGECCGEAGGCVPYPDCVAYEHGTLVAGSTTTPWPCGLKLPTSGTRRVTADCHIRGRRTDWNAGGAADDIVGYSIGGASIPAGTTDDGFLCAFWIASQNDGCLALKEFAGETSLGIQYRGQSPGDVLVVVHVTTDGKRWKVRATPKTDGAIVRNPGGGPVTDPRAFVGLEFAGGGDAGLCDGTDGVRDHASKLIVTGIDSGAFTDDAKYWVKLIVPDTIDPVDNSVNQDLTCRLPTSTRCSELFSSGFYNDQSVPTAYVWRMSTRTRFQYELKQYAVGAAVVYLSQDWKRDIRFAADIVGQTCEQSCTGVIDPVNTTRKGSVEAGSAWQVNAVLDRRIAYREDGSVVDDFDEAGTITTTWNARETKSVGDWRMNVWCQNPGGVLNGTGNNPVAVPTGNATYATQVKTGFYATLGGWLFPFTLGPAISTASSQLTGSEVYAFSSSNGVFTWAIALGREFTSRSHYEYNTTGSNGSYSKTVYDFEMTVSVEALDVACAGARALTLPDEADARKRLAAWMGEG